MTDKSLMPNSPTLMNAGRELGQLFRLFLFFREKNSLEGIFETVKIYCSNPQKRRRYRFFFLKTEAKKRRCQINNGVSSGPVSFMESIQRCNRSC
jgi:ribonucleoside-diphosphate reductase alpha chain